MATQWDGKSRGTVLGYKIFIFFINNLGIKAAYFILYFVALYYCFFSRKGTQSIYYYFRKRRRNSSLKSAFLVFKNYVVFGKTLIDKTAIASGLRNKFTYDFDGVHYITDLLKQGKGGILISAHVGNFELAPYFFEDIDSRSQINLVTTDAEHLNIKEYLEGVTLKSKIKTILIKSDLSHIFEINTALTCGELVCFTGDRFVEGSKYMTENLLEKVAKFPTGPFLLASRLQVPVLFVYVMKETNKHYHLYARKAQASHRDAQGLLKSYAKNVEEMLDKYPLQWFNYFNFWDEKK
ncbi:MAG: lipid A biosynthesis acyltransferase [Flavobacteriaceae bacterium]|nr:lipid A biosynthesis acyltransferase [Flavobacteriaceae bacterium]